MDRNIMERRFNQETNPRKNFLKKTTVGLLAIAFIVAGTTYGLHQNTISFPPLLPMIPGK